MNIVEINLAGEFTPRDVTRKGLADELNLHIRDLRPIFSLSQVATIMSRGTVIVLNLGIIKLLITPQKVIVGNLSERIISEEFIVGLSEKIKNKLPDEPLESWVMDFAMNSKVNRFTRQVQKLERSVEKALKKLDSAHDNKSLEKLLLRKKELSKLEINLKENLNAAEELINEDEELQDLCITQVARGIETEDILFEEVESIIDSFVEQIEVLLHSIEEIKENIDDTQEIVSLKLGTQRNVIIKFELIASLVTVVFSFLAVITGLYGMNIKNHFEESNIAFAAIVAVFLLVLILFFVWIWRQLKKLNIF